MHCRARKTNSVPHNILAKHKAMQQVPRDMKEVLHSSPFGPVERAFDEHYSLNRKIALCLYLPSQNNTLWFPGCP